ncbi:receptor for activated protein kinase C [Culex quinquefasciatus]|uniref:Receptor for activated protein kinase C n=1 Tax=Culex quinquefasciatus TaxID=7176 RepID=B0XE36_CULQU|nr:receptor for activated protein kinase C [Culex quinquefasciatus]|eukprot:XP_001867908.1 receptor for activated protein kinase C [Culex quinquefasciatus]
MTEMLQLCGQLVGHSGCGTLIAANPKYTDMVLSSNLQTLEHNDDIVVINALCFSTNRAKIKLTPGSLQQHSYYKHLPATTNAIDGGTSGSGGGGTWAPRSRNSDDLDGGYCPCNNFFFDASNHNLKGLAL